MRSTINSWWAKALFGLLLLSFVSFYGKFSKDEMNTGVVAKVNGEDILSKDVSFRVQNVLAFYQNMGLLKGEIPAPMVEKIKGDVVNELIAQKLFSDAAKNSGMVVSHDEVREGIQKAFTKDGEAFNFQNYKRILESRFGRSPASFEKSEGERLVAAHFQDLLSHTNFVSDAELQQTYEEQNTKVKLSFVKLEDQKMTPFIQVPSPTAEQIKAYFDAHKTEFSVPEKRDFEVSYIQTENFLPSPTSDELNSIMRENFKGDEVAKGKETRFRASHILIRSSDKKTESSKKILAENILSRLKNGENFAALAKEKSEDGSASNGGDLGYFGKGAMVPEFEKALASLKPNQISGIVKTNFGFHIIQLSDLIAPGDLTVERLNKELVSKWKESILNDPKKREPYLTKAMAASKLSDKTLAFKNISQSSSWNGLPDNNDGSLLFSNTDTLKEGEISKPIKSLEGRYVYIAKLIKKTAGYQPELSVIENQVKEKWLNEEKSKQRKTYYAGILKANENQSLESIAKKYGLQVEKTEFFSKSPEGTIPTIGSSKEITVAAFGANKGSILPETFNANGESLIVRVDDKQMPDLQKFDAEKKTLQDSQQESNNMLRRAEWVESMKKKAKVLTLNTKK